MRGLVIGRAACRPAPILTFSPLGGEKGHSLPDEAQHGRGEKAERQQYYADRAEADAEPHEDGDAGDDRGRREHDRDLGEAAAELVMLEPVVREFARLGRRIRPFLNRVQAVLGLLGILVEVGDGRLESCDLFSTASCAFGSARPVFCASSISEAVSTTVERIFLAW